MLRQQGWDNDWKGQSAKEIVGWCKRRKEVEDDMVIDWVCWNTDIGQEVVAGGVQVAMVVKG